MHYMDAKKMYVKKTWRQLHKITASNIKQVLQTVHQKAVAVRPPTTNHENYTS